MSNDSSDHAALWLSFVWLSVAGRRAETSRSSVSRPAAAFVRASAMARDEVPERGSQAMRPVVRRPLSKVSSFICSTARDHWREKAGGGGDISVAPCRVCGDGG